MNKIVVFLMVVFCVVLLSCEIDKPNTASIDLSRAEFEAEAEVDMVRDRIKDDIFWKSTYRAAELIEETIDDGKLTVVSFKLKTSEEETIVLEDFYIFRLVDADDVWREFFVDQIIYALATSDEVIEKEESGINLYIDSVILKWTDSSTGENLKASVCDIDNDGKWNYLSCGEMYFTNIQGNAIIPIKESAYGIGILPPEKPKVLRSKNNSSLSLFTTELFG